MVSSLVSPPRQRSAFAFVRTPYYRTCSGGPAIGFLEGHRSTSLNVASKRPRRDMRPLLSGGGARWTPNLVGFGPKVPI